MRCYCVHNLHLSNRTNVIGALVDKFLLTVSVFDCNINTTIFNCWIEQYLIQKITE
ncbi:hypothetical protein OTSKATO_0057 [Orientia tsutsugamushi str. Kato PP]|uniref:Transposase n=1 Tax=Orientia tsutsugamushi TaxID=784 RepID=A0A2U3RA28_ORITS|nr:hypothetical protein OTSKATO_0057 [Orientia tsutsugamushi str. Kato PP]SPR10072.1 Uncharacterised protein [Orientia tsutsugamushi]